MVGIKIKTIKIVQCFFLIDFRRFYKYQINNIYKYGEGKRLIDSL
jgi:hypothetical protein